MREEKSEKMKSFAFCYLYFSRSSDGYICVRKRIRMCMRESVCVCVCRRKMERDAERCVRVHVQDMHMQPPKNGDIALWPNTRVVKCKYHVSQKRNESNIKVQRYKNYSITYLNSWLGFISLKNLYSVISKELNLLRASIRIWQSTCFWTARVQFLASWAEQKMCKCKCTRTYVCIQIEGCVHACTCK